MTIQYIQYSMQSSSFFLSSSQNILFNFAPDNNIINQGLQQNVQPTQTHKKIWALKKGTYFSQPLHGNETFQTPLLSTGVIQSKIFPSLSHLLQHILYILYNRNGSVPHRHTICSSTLSYV